ncbi:SagB/ThcOx family dehydrogenase [Candidatus Roizmanbacteria bacterium]|nr:SagB/ThcOx family dehydrogenase [Candidatus Roizmanbacteria bacterium]
MTKNNTKELLEKIEGKQFTSDRFHILTNNKRLETPNIKGIPQSWIKIHFKTYPRLDKIKVLTKSKISDLSNIIKKRKSVRSFSGRKISQNQIFHLLLGSCGLIKEGKDINQSRRPYPSAGARYPLEVYAIILNCKEIKKGLYHYNVKENSLELLLEENLNKWLIETTGGEKWIANAGVVFIITGVLDRTRIKYGDRGYRYTLIEAGHVGQNICLLATELGLGCCSLGGFIDYKVNNLLDIDLQKEVSLYLIAIGRI